MKKSIVLSLLLLSSVFMYSCASVQAKTNSKPQTSTPVSVAPAPAPVQAKTNSKPQTSTPVSVAPAPAPVKTNSPVVKVSGAHDMIPETETQGPVSTFYPVYESDGSKLIEASASGRSEKEAKESAIANFIIDNKCEDVVIAKVITKKYDANKYDVIISGYPIRVVGVKEVKPAFYELDITTGTITPVEKLEHRFLFVKPFVVGGIIQGGSWINTIFSSAENTSKPASKESDMNQLSTEKEDVNATEQSSSSKSPLEYILHGRN